MLAAVVLSGCTYLTVEQVPGASNDVAVKNERNVVLLAFDAITKNTAETALQNLRFVSANDEQDLLNAQSYSLHADTNGDGIVDREVMSGVTSTVTANGRRILSFDNIDTNGFSLRKENTVRFEVHAHIAQSFISPVLQLAFHTADPQYVKATKTDDDRQLIGVQTNGSCTANEEEECEVTVRTTQSTKYALKNAGSLHVTQQPVRERQILGGTSATALHLTLNASHEDVDVRKMGFIVSSSQSTLPNTVSRLDLYRPAETTPFASATVAGCAGGGGGGGGGSVFSLTFCASLAGAQLRIVDGGAQSVIVRPVINTDQNGGVSGMDVTVKVSGSGELGMTVEAVGTKSSVDLSQNNGDGNGNGEVFIGTASFGQNADIVSPTHMTVMSKIASITNGDPNPDGMPVTAGNDRVLGAFTFSAAPNNNALDGTNEVVISDLIFTLKAQNVALDTYRLINTKNPFNHHACQVVGSENETTLFVQCDNMDNTPIEGEVTLEPGESKTIALIGNIINDQVSPSLPSNIQVSLKNFSDPDLQETFGPSESHVQWIDSDNRLSKANQWIDYPETEVQSTRYGVGAGSSSSSVSSSQSACFPGCAGNEDCIDGECVPQNPGGEDPDAALSVRKIPLVSQNTAVKNEKNITLLRFEATASDDADLLLTQAHFQTAGIEGGSDGNLHNASNYTLWIDTNNDGVVDTIAQSGVSAVSGFDMEHVRFDALTGGGYVIPRSESVTFEVHADVQASFVDSPSFLRLGFGYDSAFIGAERLSDGAPLSGISCSNADGTAAMTDGCTEQPGQGDIHVSDVFNGGTTFTLHSSGDLYVTASVTPVRNRQLLGGTLGEEILRLTLQADYEDIDVANLTFTAHGADAALFATNNVERLELFHPGAEAPFATATVGSCVAEAPTYSMCASMNNNQLVVPRGQDVDVLVRPRMRTDVGGSEKGKNVRVRVEGSASGFSGVRARGALSSMELPRNDGDGVAEGELFIGTKSASAQNTAVDGNLAGHENAHVVVHSKVTSITNTSPDADGTAMTVGNDRAIGQFTFTAASHNNTRDGLNDWSLYGLIFDVNASNVQLGDGDQTNPATSDFMIYNKADPTTKVPCTADKPLATGQLVVTCTDLIDQQINTSIDAGSSAIFVLEADVVNTQVSAGAPSTLQVSLGRFTDRTATSFGPDASHIRWVDDDNGNDAVFHWVEHAETTVNSTLFRN